MPADAPRDPVADLRSIAFLLERSREPTYRVRAFRTAADALAEVSPTVLAELMAAGTLTAVKGIGKTTAACIEQSLRGQIPDYLQQRAAEASEPEQGDEAVALRAALRGDCHLHSDWSDGGSPIREMALTARALGHQYAVLTDHSPRLTVARGLTADRLERQLDEVAALNESFAAEATAGTAPEFRLLTGIEVDINVDGTLDQQPALLARLDVVVASVHSQLRMPADEMTARMVAAISNPHTDILGHCTGRLVTGGRGTRPESSFEAEVVFAACAQFGVAVEINSRPERLDPPIRLLQLVVEAGCLVSIDTDAHAPGQLDWQHYGCARAARCRVPAATVVNTWPIADLLAWAADHSAAQAS